MNKINGNTPDPRETALRALVEIEKKELFINLILNRVLQQLPSDKRPLAKILVYGTIQHLNTLQWAINHYSRNPLASMTPWIRNNLLMATFQLLYMNNIPDAVVVDKAVNLAYRFGHKGVAGLTNAVLRKINREKDNLPWPDIKKDPLQYISLAHSHPVWLVKRWVERYGIEEATSLCRANNHNPPIIFRTNFLAISRDNLKLRLKEEKIETEENEALTEALRVTGNPGVSPGSLNTFKEGLFTVQGEASMFCANLLNPPPGSCVIDMCSAPGGKTTHLAEKMKNSGHITAIDTHEGRLRLVEETAKRLGINIIKVLKADSRKLKGIVKPVSHILLDAPCSGLGVINRRPDLKWRKRENDIENLSLLQRELLNSASTMLQKGGRLLYSVCTNEKEETEDVIWGFLKENPEFRAVDIHPLNEFIPSGIDAGKQKPMSFINFYPHHHQREGFFIALLEKT